ncbi:MAG TPA: hypothetical protein VGX21_01350 [Methylomirabilota bacterium]|jgi:hypothetical protein|nr:hypothetical protein [Methylomirabilota bacterium]
MRQILAWIAAASVVAGLTGAALAQRPAPEPAPSAGTPTGGVVTPAPPSGGELRSQTTVSGEITSVDAARGTVRLRTAGGEVEVPLAPGVLQGIQLGDRLDVQLGVRPAGAPGGETPQPVPGAGLRPEQTIVPSAGAGLPGPRPGVPAQPSRTESGGGTTGTGAR